MTTTINWLTPHGDAVKLMSPKKHQLDMRVAEEFWDVEQADVGLWADKYVMMSADAIGATVPGVVVLGRTIITYLSAQRPTSACSMDYMAEVRKALGK